MNESRSTLDATVSAQHWVDYYAELLGEQTGQSPDAKADIYSESSKLKIKQANTHKLCLSMCRTQVEEDL
ncbi:Hypothetical predicted protein [Podarcis lilfordi]|uniref:Uncharacterized protein n=1 Tax=Podarcis lilfordi TaxID=74358 RepID=A0AA35P7E4_9SAUR|nr:Hypothetical predicted protein [Podarcis lilfordi]